MREGAYLRWPCRQPLRSLGRERVRSARPIDGLPPISSGLSARVDAISPRPCAGLGWYRCTHYADPGAMAETTGLRPRVAHIP